MDISLKLSNKYNYPSQIVVINQVIWFRVFLHNDRYDVVTATAKDDDLPYLIKEHNSPEMLETLRLLQLDLFGDEQDINDFLEHDSWNRPYYSLLSLENINDDMDTLLCSIDKIISKNISNF